MYFSWICIRMLHITPSKLLSFSPLPLPFLPSPPSHPSKSTHTGNLLLEGTNRSEWMVTDSSVDQCWYTERNGRGTHPSVSQSHQHHPRSERERGQDRWWRWSEGLILSLTSHNFTQQSPSQGQFNFWQNTDFSETILVFSTPVQCLVSGNCLLACSVFWW